MKLSWKFVAKQRLLNIRYRKSSCENRAYKEIMFSSTFSNSDTGYISTIKIKIATYFVWIVTDYSLFHLYPTLLDSMSFLLIRIYDSVPSTKWSQTVRLLNTNCSFCFLFFMCFSRKEGQISLDPVVEVLVSVRMNWFRNMSKLHTVIDCPQYVLKSQINIYFCLRRRL